MPIESVNSGGRAHQIHWCMKLSFLLCKQATADLQMKPGTTMELGRFSDIMMEQLMMSRHQHKPAASTKLHVTTLLLAPDLQSTRKSSSKLAMSSSSNAAVSETAASRTVERRSSHIRHGGRERRDRYLPPDIAPCWRSFFSHGRPLVGILVEPHGRARRRRLKCVPRDWVREEIEVEKGRRWLFFSGKLA